MNDRSPETRVVFDAVRRSQETIRLLVETHQIAMDAKCEQWQFALELTCLKATGISNTDLRLLVWSKLVTHAHEVTLQGAKKRSFKQSRCLGFSAASCFLISDIGLSKLRHEAIVSDNPEPLTTPRWIVESRELLFDGRVVKHFRRPAPNQETVLTTFQDDMWILRIDDPLSPLDGRDPKRRLHDTINALNRNQKNACVRFFGDGTGEGVCWEARPN